MILTFFFPENLLAATDDNFALDPVPMVSGQPLDSPLEALDRGHRLGLLLDYVQKEAPGWAPGLRSAIRAPGNWAANGLRAAGNSLGLGGSDDENEGFFAPLYQPISDMLQTPSSSDPKNFWMIPGYHHKGFLPVHDAMTMGFNLRQYIFEDHIELDARPFYGQNWMSLNNYGGAEIGVNLSRTGEAQPWGRIAVRYTQGDQDLMDQGHGIDMHAEMRFTDSLSLHAGVREQEETELGNYVLLRWKLADFGP